MTTIAVLKTPESVLVAADTAGTTNAGMKLPVNFIKVFEDNSNWIFAVAGPVRLANNLKITKAKLDTIQGVVEHLRSMLEEGIIPRLEGEDEAFDGEVIAINKKTKDVYNIDGDFSWIEIPEDTIWTIGSGGNYAMAAGIALKDMNIKPLERLVRSVRTACILDSGSSDPVNFYEYDRQPK